MRPPRRPQPGASDRLAVAAIRSEARNRARWRDLTAGEEAAALAALRGLAGGRAVLLDEAARILEAAGTGRVDGALRLQAGALCRKAAGIAAGPAEPPAPDTGKRGR